MTIKTITLYLDEDDYDLHVNKREAIQHNGGEHLTNWAKYFAFLRDNGK